jgi:hypothetical protein
MTINGPAEHFLGLCLRLCAGKNDETGKMSDMWCAEVIFNAHHRQEKKNTKGKNVKTKERKKTSWPERCCCPM